MSLENVEAFRRGADAFRRGDLDVIVSLVHPRVVWEPLRAATEGAFVGRDGVRRFWADTLETFERFQADYTEVRDLGDRVLAIGSIRVRGKGSGVETDVPTAAIVEYRDGLVWRYKDYGDRGKALEAAGLHE